MTLRSNDQFNTTVYGMSDRLRGIEGDRMLVMMSPDDMAAAGLAAEQRITLTSAAEDGSRGGLSAGCASLMTSRAAVWPATFRN